MLLRLSFVHLKMMIQNGGTRCRFCVEKKKKCNPSQIKSKSLIKVSTNQLFERFSAATLEL